MGFFVLLFVFMLFDFFFDFFLGEGVFCICVCLSSLFKNVLFFICFFLFFGNAEYVIIFIYLNSHAFYDNSSIKNHHKIALDTNILTILVTSA